MRLDHPMPIIQLLKGRPTIGKGRDGNSSRRLLLSDESLPPEGFKIPGGIF
jgi:hypothetical protein